MAGYSGTPLPKKLGIKEGFQILAVGAPEDYRRLLGPLSPSVRFVSRDPLLSRDIHGVSIEG